MLQSAYSEQEMTFVTLLIFILLLQFLRLCFGSIRISIQIVNFLLAISDDLHNGSKEEFLSNKEQEKHLKNNEWSRDKFSDEELKALVIRMVTEIGIRIYENRILTRN